MLRIRAFFVVAMMASAGLGLTQLRYDEEYEGLTYRPDLWEDPVSALGRDLDSGAVLLQRDGPSGYLASLLRALDVPVSSQTLVFTQTSVQKRLISPRAPRAIYFSDDVYVAWAQGSRSLEIVAIDPVVGPVFYTLDQAPEKPAALVPQTFMCLRCHDSYSLTGGGVPRLLMGSMIPGPDGQQVLHEGWALTSTETPLSKRWGGWYVTGTHGEQPHLGNVFVGSAAELTSPDRDPLAGANVTDLSNKFDVEPYLSGHSDIVALLVLEHQVEVVNAITRVSFDARTAIARAGGDASALPQSTRSAIDEMTEPLVDVLRFENEAPLGAPVEGTTSFAKDFESRGPRTADGRSLRDFDLETKLFRYPVSYLIDSALFDALPVVVRERVYRRLMEELTDDDHVELLAQTKAEFQKFRQR